MSVDHLDCIVGECAENGVDGLSIKDLGQLSVSVNIVADQWSSYDHFGVCWTWICG